ncbi:calcium channel flower homolog [Acanthaster planci]|uniref:Calcium channel flower homolog n=1 Tax=Acanthaster planci TaxID=133434 RepID=A0A8B7YNQ8_ACAPL|nr:calcium channel flower homolog [Acanthaster planci]XP_022094909.1 calcium channel flower homolog [Acanthaster planci]XP_022094910.1 calcium channel flower homolog [Acanthaster planci]
MSEAPSQNQNISRQADEGPGKCTSFTIRAVAAVAGIICMITGCITFISISAMCIVAGVYLILLGFLIEMFEAPICCQYFRLTDKINTWGSSLPSWFKALMYFILPIFAIVMCQGLSVILGALVVAAVGIMYGMVFIGKKGDGVRNAQRSHQFDAVNLVETEEHSFTKSNP